MPNERVAIVAYYWPPTGGSGVQRWLKFAKYLPEFGWAPTIVTPRRPALDLRDPSLERDVPPEATVLRVEGWEPYGVFQRLARVISGKQRPIRPTELVSRAPARAFDRLAIRIRGNLFVPDPKIYWARAAANALEPLLRNGEIRTIVTTGPPHSLHLAGLRLKRRLPSIRWIADFRDPWSEWGFLDSLATGALARARHRRLEATVLRAADDIVTITPFYQRRFEALGGRSVTLLTNGYDEEDFEGLVHRRPERFTVRHVGTVNELCNPRPFMLAAAGWCASDETLRRSTVIEFVGEVHPDFVGWVREHLLLASITRFVPPVPHDQLLSLYGETSVGLLVLTGYRDAAGYLPGKLLEYFAAGIPVLGIGPVDGDAAHAIEETKAGVMVAESDEVGIHRALGANYEAWRTNRPIHVAVAERRTYSRREITRQLARLLGPTG